MSKNFGNPNKSGKFKNVTIRKKVEEVRNILPEARQDKAFELGKFKYALKKLSDEVEELTKEAKGSE